MKKKPRADIRTVLLPTAAALLLLSSVYPLPSARAEEQRSSGRSAAPSLIGLKLSQKILTIEDHGQPVPLDKAKGSAEKPKPDAETLQRSRKRAEEKERLRRELADLPAMDILEQLRLGGVELVPAPLPQKDGSLPPSSEAQKTAGNLCVTTVLIYNGEDDTWICGEKLSVSQGGKTIWQGTGSYLSIPGRSSEYLVSRMRDSTKKRVNEFILACRAATDAPPVTK